MDIPEFPLAISNKFMTLHNNMESMSPFMSTKELNTVFTRAARKLKAGQLNFLGFIHILEELCNSLLPDQSVESSMRTIIPRL